MKGLIEVLLDPGFDPAEVYGLGSWFLVPDADIRLTGSKRIFAPDKARKEGRRPTVVAGPLGPNMILFPRTTKDQWIEQDVHRHRAHDHEPCDINHDGWVLLHVPCNVSVGELVFENWSCVEPEASDLHAMIKRRLAP